MRDMSSGLYVANECIINYQHLNMRVTAAKIAANFASACPFRAQHRWRVTSEINIVSFVKVRRRRLSPSLFSATQSAVLGEGAEQTPDPKSRAPQTLSQHIHDKRGHSSAMC